MRKQLLTHNSPKTSLYQQERGSVLPLSIFMFTLASLASVYMITLTQNDRNKTVALTQKTSAFYAMEGAAQHARVNIESYVKTRLSQAYKAEDWRATNAHFLDPSNASINHGINIHNFFSTITNTTGSLTSKRQSLDYNIVYFYDKNLNGVQEIGEESFVVVKAPPSGQGDQQYIYRYSATVTGKSGEVSRSAFLTGEISFGIEQARFSKYGLFTNTHLLSAGGNLSKVWFTGDHIFDGPVHTNGDKSSTFNFAPTSSKTSTSATFKDDVTSSNKDITFAKAGGDNPVTVTPDLTDKTPIYTKSGYNTRPQYNTTYERGVAKIDLPPNNLSQTRAALGGDILNTDPISDTELRNSLGLGGSGAINNDIYVPQNGTSVKGGIYVKGDVDTALLAVDNQNRQVIDLTQGKKTVTITLDLNNNQTIVKTTQRNTAGTVTSTTTDTFSGTLNGMLQVDGKIKNLAGPARQGNDTQKESPVSAPPAIQKNNKMTISATEDIVITRDIKYQDDPRGTDRTWGGADNLEAENMLGLFSGGNVRIGCTSGSGENCQSPRNIEIHASILATKKTEGMFIVDNYDTRPENGSVNLLGGVIQNHYGTHGTFSAKGKGTGFGRNYSYDRRFKTSSPPFFPTTNEVPKVSAPLTSVLDWKEIKSKDLV